MDICQTCLPQVIKSEHYNSHVEYLGDDTDGHCFECNTFEDHPGIAFRERLGVELGYAKIREKDRREGDSGFHGTIHLARAIQEVQTLKDVMKWYDESA